MYKDLLKKVFCELALEYEKQIAEVNPQLDAECLALLKTKDFAIELLVAKTHQYDTLVEKVKELVIHYSEFEMYGKNYNAIFKTIIELKEMVGFEDE